MSPKLFGSAVFDIVSIEPNKRVRPTIIPFAFATKDTSFCFNITILI